MCIRAGIDVFLFKIIWLLNKNFISLHKKDMETRKKLGKRIKTNHKNGKIVIGTVNKIDCRAVYVRLETWMTPVESLESSIAAIRKRFIANTYKLSNIYFDGLKTSIIDYDYLCTSSIDLPGRKSFVSIEITLLAKDRFEFDKDFIFNGQAFGDNCFSLLETLSEHFSMSTTKK
jgi:hypothetical protein